ncbi:FtsX-like permease family protein [Leucobacter sp. wl10]|uniref:FtsX-like permease family protein n=1 Tax=Leucobacter sp. wl10 TaxID=2304677 RepID=UPI000E5AA2E3|nr:FtsX-like permease family protein [Leucobacter sp. wl10]RGE22759.1 permease [Leucobacter sp. wl10]
MSAVWMLVRPRRGSAALSWMQLAASAVTALLAFAVAMLAAAFWRVPSAEEGYRVLAIGLVGVLVVPLVTLGTATARLAARSRDDRLATLRLLGASARRVRRTAVAEIALLAIVGVAAGTLLASGLPFALSLLGVLGAPLTVYGEPLDPAQLWLPWWASAAIPPLLVAVAAASALLGLRRVVLSPLGVRTRQDAPRMSRLRLVAAVAVLAAAVLVTQLVSPDWGLTVVFGALTVAVIGVSAVLGVAGPFAVTLFARSRAARTSNAAALVAARGILDDPRAAWRQVSAVALASFVLIPAGSLLGYLDAIQRSKSRAIMTRDQLLLFGDARTMLIALVAVSFLVVACQVAITQTAAVLERHELYVALDRIGMPRAELDRARRLRVTGAANVAVVGASTAAAVLGAALLFIAVVVAPLFVAAVVVLLLLGLLLIRAGVAATSPVMRRVLDAPGRGE